MPAGQFKPWKPSEPEVKGAFVDPQATIHQRSTVGPESIVGSGSTLGERSSVKKSVVGKVLLGMMMTIMIRSVRLVMKSR